MPWLTLDSPDLQTNLDTFEALNTLANTLMGYPNPSTGTLTYAEATYHPNGVFIAFPVQGAVEYTYYNDPQVKQYVDTLVPGAPSKLVESLPPDWVVDHGDG